MSNLPAPLLFLCLFAIIEASLLWGLLRLAPCYLGAFTQEGWLGRGRRKVSNAFRGILLASAVVTAGVMAGCSHMSISNSNFGIFGNTTPKADLTKAVLPDLAAQDQTVPVAQEQIGEAR